MISDEQAEQFVKAMHEKTQRDQEPKVIVLSNTERGFAIGEFFDLSGAHCSIQKSSLATDDAIWLGVDVAYDGEELHGGRMQINRQTVQALLPLLTKFAETGEL